MNKIEEIELSKIDSFKNHPFKVNNDESLKELSKSIKENGLLNPLLVRKKENGRYELISGHRRKLAMENMGLTKANAIVKDLTYEEAIVEMVDSNMYRDKILPSEKAYAYKMKLDAMKHQGKKIKTSDNECPKLSTEKIGKDYGDSSSTVKNYIRLTNLIPELLQLVDDTVLKDKRTALTMGLKPAVELSYLNKEQQQLVYMGITYEDLTPSHGQALEPLGYEIDNIKIETPEIQADDVTEVSKFSAKWAAERLNKPVLKNDSGLFVNALNGFPGVYTHFVDDNMDVTGPSCVPYNELIKTIVLEKMKNL